MYSIKYYIQLLKFRLSVIVVFSAVSGYLLGTKDFDNLDFLLVILGGFLVTGSANGFNQILEKDYDKLMQRTAERPLPQQRIKTYNAVIFCIFTGIVGLYILNLINPETSYFGIFSKSCFFGLIAMALYVLSYTPLKRLSTISIFVGAIPGAIPFLLGWVAATDDFGLAAGILFSIQFFWQFPHFISIAWVQDEQYKKAGFKMLFGGKKNAYPIIISIGTAILMTLVSVIPYFWGHEDLRLSSSISFWCILLLGIWFISKSFKLYNKQQDQSAKELMIASFIYLPAMQIIYIIDKLIFYGL